MTSAPFRVSLPAAGTRGAALGTNRWWRAGAGEVMTELAVALIAQGAILAPVLCVMESRADAANRFLAGLLVAISVRLLAQLLVNRLSVGHQLLNALHNTSFLIGPLLYFYTLALVERPLRLRPAQLWHALPAALATLWSLSALAGYDRPTDSAVVRVSALHGLFATLSIALYCGAVLRRLAIYRRGLLDRCSAIERISLNWLKVLVWIVLVSGAAIAVVHLVRLVTGWALDPSMLVVLPLSIVLFYAVAILGFRQSTILLMGGAEGRGRVQNMAPIEPEPMQEREPHTPTQIPALRVGGGTRGACGKNCRR